MRYERPREGGRPFLRVALLTYDRFLLIMLQSPQEMWRKLQVASPPFFESLQWLPDGQELWSAIKELKPCVLTGLPRGKWAEPQKRAWCKQHLGTTVAVYCCKSKDKKNYAVSTPS